MTSSQLEVKTDPILDEKNLNLASPIIEYTACNKKVLFTGDAEKENEDTYTSLDKIDILKVGHHGSKTSTSKKFLEKINPTYSIISVGANNRYNLPNSETLKRIEEISTTYLTSEKGTITAIIGEDKIEFSFEK